ncbi:MAG TPA: twin-arginine translocation signal domain-containing protein, partial [Anaerolineales bacterium]|nr:twin-arginine translocation signal domain-containing protein [Anaerolineales bacterium]
MSRRDFLKLSALTGAVIPWSAFNWNAPTTVDQAASLQYPSNPSPHRPLPPEDIIDLTPLKIVRVAIKQDEVRVAPSLDARIRSLQSELDLARA